MRVAQLTPYFPPHLGGVEFHVKELAEELAARGHDVEVFTTDVPGGGCGSDVEVTRFSALPLPYAPLVPGLSLRLDRLLDGYDVVHSHLPPPFFTAAAPGENHVATYHCDFEVPETLSRVPVPSPVRGFSESLYDALYGPDVERCDAVIATTESYAETSDVLRDLDYRVVPNGVRPDEFTYSLDKEPYALFVGRLAASKGVTDLVDAAPRMLRETGLEEVRIVGEGEEEKTLRRRAADVHGVRLLGSLPFEELKEQYAGASLVVLPSTSRLEAFGIVQLEAFASGTPVLASDVPGVREVGVEGETSLLFEPGDPESLADAAADLLSRDTEAMGRAARELVEERYTWSGVAERVEAVYRDVLY